MPRFVILRHDGPQGVHFDFMLEAGDALKTWSLPRPPEIGLEMECHSLPDHRLFYLDYEGPISGDRGSVSRWDQGTYRVERQEEMKWVLEMKGEKLQGRAVLSRSESNSDQWQFSLCK
jgi:hypothetical protein